MHQKSQTSVKVFKVHFYLTRAHTCMTWKSLFKLNTCLKAFVSLLSPWWHNTDGHQNGVKSCKFVRESFYSGSFYNVMQWDYSWCTSERRNVIEDRNAPQYFTSKYPRLLRHAMSIPERENTLISNRWVTYARHPCYISPSVGVIVLAYRHVQNKKLALLSASRAIRAFESISRPSSM